MRCRCGRYRRFVWDAGRELCNGCELPASTCRCTPLWAEQIGLVNAIQQVHTPHYEPHEGMRMAKTAEQVWVQVRNIGVMVEAERGRAVAGDIMHRTRAPVGALHVPDCAIARSPSYTCSCTPTMLRSEEDR
jgi:hypothetical protein